MTTRATTRRSTLGLLAECFEMAYELRTEAEERDVAEDEPASEEVNNVGTKA